jgi:hypothetical protein
MARKGAPHFHTFHLQLSRSTHKPFADTQNRKFCNRVYHAWQVKGWLITEKNIQDAAVVVNPSEQVRNKYFPTWSSIGFQCLHAALNDGGEFSARLSEEFEALS